MERLYEKYIINKTDGSPVDPNAEYFVLRLDTDVHARKASIAYAESIMEENPKFAADILYRTAIYVEEA